VRLPCLPLMFPSPHGPVQMKRERDAILGSQQLQQPADLGNAVAVAYDTPFFAVALRATTKAA
jgi:hypothetical protein